MDTLELWTGILDASRDGDAVCVHKLLEAGADPNWQDIFDGYTPLHNAITSGNVQLVEQLLDAGADIEHSNNTVHQTPLVTAVFSRKTEMVRLLISRGANSGVTLYPDDEPLIDFARKEGNADIIALLTSTTTTNNPAAQPTPIRRSRSGGSPLGGAGHPKVED